MELVQIYNQYSFAQVLMGIIIFLSIASWFCVLIWVTTTTTKNKIIKYCGLLLITGIIIVASIVQHNSENISVYIYHVTNFNDLSKMIHDGWKIYSQNGNLYDLIRR